MKCAYACYGRQHLTAGFGKKDNPAALQKFLDLAPDDKIHKVEWKGSMFYPSYFIYVDKEKASIVFAVRGTRSMDDALTDLVAEPMPFYVRRLCSMLQDGALCGLRTQSDRRKATRRSECCRLPIGFSRSTKACLRNFVPKIRATRWLSLATRWALV